MKPFTTGDLLSCPKHVEAKQLANKLWVRMFNLSDKIYELGQSATVDNPNLDKLTHLCEKYDKIYIEYLNIIRGLQKCGCYETI